MNSILERIFMGEINQNERADIRENVEYEVLLGITNKLEKELLEKLWEEEKVLYNNLMQKNSEVSRFLRIFDFTEGFKIGANIMLACVN